MKYNTPSIDSAILTHTDVYVDYTRTENPLDYTNKNCKLNPCESYEYLHEIDPLKSVSI